MSNIQAWTDPEHDAVALHLALVLVALMLVLCGALLRPCWTERERQRRLALLDTLAGGGD